MFLGYLTYFAGKPQGGWRKTRVIWPRLDCLKPKFRPGGDPLPSEKDLVDMFGVARDTAHRAVQALREAGLVVTIPQARHLCPAYFWPVTDPSGSGPAA